MLHFRHIFPYNWFGAGFKACISLRSVQLHLQVNKIITSGEILVFECLNDRLDTNIPIRPN